MTRPTLVLYVGHLVSPKLRRRLAQMLTAECGTCTLIIRVQEVSRTTYEFGGVWSLRPGELHDRLGRVFERMATS